MSGFGDEDEDYIAMLKDELKGIKCERDRLKAENARLVERLRGEDDGGHWYSHQTMTAVANERDKLMAERDELQKELQFYKFGRVPHLAVKCQDLAAERDRYLKLLRDIKNDWGPTLDDPRLRYVEGQLSRVVLDDLHNTIGGE